MGVGSMDFEERSFSGKLFRPRPEISRSDNGYLLAIITPWGAREHSKEAISLLHEYVSASFEDQDVTSPFEKLTCFSPLGNSMRIAVLLCNDLFYRSINEKELQSGLELFVGGYANQEFFWVQVGNPQLILLRPGRGAIPLASQMDLSFEMSQAQQPLPPLPSRLLGVSQHVNLNIGSIRPQPGDRLLLLSRSDLPPSLFATDLDHRGLAEITQLIARDNPDIPFWIGIITL